MTLAQRFRWFVYRLRARFTSAPDNAPIVSIETADEKPTIAARVRARLHRYLRVAGGFVVTLLLLGAIGLYLLAMASRVSLDSAPVYDTREHAPRAVSAAEYLFALPQTRTLGTQHLFATPSLRRRDAATFAAAAEPARAYVAMMRVRRGARDPLFEQAREAAADQGGRIAAESLDRLSAAASRRQIVIDRSADAFRALAVEAAAALAARAAELAERAHGNGEALDDDAAFHTARGEAYGWLLLLQAAAADSEDTAIRDAPALARALTALERAADYRPVLFVAGPRGGPFAPNHLAVIGLDLAIAAQETRALARP